MQEQFPGCSGTIDKFSKQLNIFNCKRMSFRKIQRSERKLKIRKREITFALEFLEIEERNCVV